MPRRTRKGYPKDVRYFNNDGESIQAVAYERNGNLIYVEDNKGNCTWIFPIELDNED
jgi:hypothetical protein